MYTELACTENENKWWGWRRLTCGCGEIADTVPVTGEHRLSHLSFHGNHTCRLWWTDSVDDVARPMSLSRPYARSVLLWRFWRGSTLALPWLRLHTIWLSSLGFIMQSRLPYTFSIKCITVTTPPVLRRLYRPNQLCFTNWIGLAVKRNVETLPAHHDFSSSVAVCE